jgi:hypothetical protein
MIKTLALSLVATAAVAGAALAPAAASAQPYRYERGYAPYHLTSGYVDGLFWKLDNAAAEGRISWREAHRLKAELRPVQEFAHPVETGRASPWQRRRLEQVVARIDAALERGSERYERGYRGYGYGYR